MSKEKNVFILLDENDVSDYASDALESLLESLSDEVMYIRSEDNKGIFITEEGDTALVQEHF